VNYYELLNIGRGADAGEIKRAYFSAVKLHSPDSDPKGFKAIRLAYETLYDPKKRAEYDGYFVTSGGAQNDLLAARSLIRENKYKQAMEFLTELSGKNPDSTDVKRLLAEVLWYLKKSGAADKICEELLEHDPSDCETLLLRAKIAKSRGYADKAGGCYIAAVKADPSNPRAWGGYMRYALKNTPNEVPNIFYSAMERDINMFRDDYILYIVGTHNNNLFNSGDNCKYYDKFAEFFINDKSPEEDIYPQIMSLIPRFLEQAELVPFVEKILPALENSKQYSDKDEKSFIYIRSVIKLFKLQSDKRIHDVLNDLTVFLFYEDKDENERLGMEIYIVYNLSLLRPSIKVLMHEYPELFKLNQAFYLDALNEKKEDYLLDKYIAIHKKIRPGFNFYYDGDEDTENVTPVRRESPKIGRNDPCPCGSGKKYKKCCGAK